MTPETIFSICNLAALLGWLLLIGAPRWRWTVRIVRAGILPMLLALVYLLLIVTSIGNVEGSFNSLAEVGRLFRNERLLLAGWVHYLAFDLFVGSWEVEDASSRTLPHLLVMPCLALTFLLGPIGFLAYRLVAFSWDKWLKGMLRRMSARI
ncbi:MAG: ABA4-like family protein [Blastocatellia bacterium]|nr:ABA4-like family protein [Blastocatellia bacterium]